MSEGSTEQVVASIVEQIVDARRKRTRGLVVVRCSGPREVDHAREALLRAPSPVRWKSLPAAQIDPPDLLGYILSRGSQDGPCFVAYGLPQGRDGRVLQRFIELITVAGRKYVMAPYLMVLVLTLDEIKDLTKGAPGFWKSRDLFVAWPVDDAGSAFVPALLRGKVARRRGGLAADQSAVAGIHGGMAELGGGIAEAGGGMAGLYGNPLMDNFELSDADYGLAPWVGAPFKEGDDVPQYVLAAAAPAGRRWGQRIAPDDPEGAELIDRCRMLLDQRHTEFARQGLAKAARHFRAHNNGPATAECYVLLGRASEIRFDHTVALEWYEQATSVYEQVGDDAGVSDCCNMIGYLRYLHGDLDGAFVFFDRALRRDEEAQDELRMAAGYRRVGIILEERREVNQALGLYEKAAEIEKRNNDRFAYARSLHHMARVHQRKDHFQEARELLEESLAIKEELQDETGLATGWHELGNIDVREAIYDSALREYQRALALEEKLGDVQGIAVTAAQIGLCQRELFNFPEAVRAFTIARELFKRMQSPYGVVMEQAVEGVRNMADARLVAEMQQAGRRYVEDLLVET